MSYSSIRPERTSGNHSTSGLRPSWNRSRCALICGLLLVAICNGICFAGVTSFAQIDRWYGTGVNEAAIVFDWNEPDRPALVWGFRWNGTATGEDMFLAVVGADPQLYARIGTPGSFGIPLYGVGVDRDNDGFALSDGTMFMDGFAVTAPSDGIVAADGEDSYVEGWNTGFWAYYNASSSPYQGSPWDSALTGMRDRQLTNGSWDGFRFAPGFVGDPPRMPENLPEPALGLGWLVLLLGLHRRRKAIAQVEHSR